MLLFVLIGDKSCLGSFVWFQVQKEEEFRFLTADYFLMDAFKYSAQVMMFTAPAFLPAAFHLFRRVGGRLRVLRFRIYSIQHLWV